MKNKIFLSFLLAILPLNTYAFDWQDLWKSKNQQAKEMMKKNDFKTATTTFRDENWRAVAAFRDKNYQMAAELFAKSSTKDASYNLGNALAHLGKYQEAIAAYDKALKEDKNQQDAAHNKDIIEKLLKQKAQQNKQQQEKQKKDQAKNKDRPKNSEQKQQNTNSKQQNPPQQAKKTPKQSKNKNNAAPQKQSKPNNKDGKNQMQEQWLKLIPDDPGGLLREKFKRDYLRRRGELNS